VSCVALPDYRHRFLQLALRARALCFGQFTLKSGRVSPYFFNAGQFLHHNHDLAELAACQADAIAANGLEYELLFGPAYKGIPLASALACELARRGQHVALSFDRKEVKDHGEGGQLMGADLSGKRVLIVDDVITAGTAVRQSLQLIRAAGGLPVGIVVALDRQEMVADDDRRCTTQVIAETEGISVITVATLDDLLAFTADDPHLVHYREPLLDYRLRYGSGPTD